MWLDVLIGAALALAVCWLVLIGALLLGRPTGAVLTEAVRLLPDLARLLRRLAADTSLPRGVRVQLWLLLAYLAMPLDLVPDVIPVLGYADDAIVVVLVLRGVVRRAGIDAVCGHWPGTDDGFVALCRITGLASAAS
ncbi:MAG: YkvA family protein [Pseudonocardiales bacterium]